MWRNTISKYLEKLNIKHEVCGIGIKIDRDSIIDVMQLPENESYDKLRFDLNHSFNAKFNYCGKTDDWLFLQILTED